MKLIRASTTAFRKFAGNWGINTEGLDDIQAAEAMISQLVPEQREPGFGTMSGADLALFKQSLPRIISQPGGNAIIIKTMRGIAQYSAAQGEIANRVANREITPKEGRQLLGKIPNPLAEFNKKCIKQPTTEAPLGIR